MKSFSIALISFILGVVLSGVIGYILAIKVYYGTVMEELENNVRFYRQIEQGKPELIQMKISSSLDIFIDMAETGENSYWVTPNLFDRQTLLKAKELQEQIVLNKGNK
jgi:hypothetical protein